MAVGSGRVAANGERIPMPVVVGDFVKFRDYAGSEVRIEGVSYIIVRAADCLAKWK
jgi:chaperonin GroES